MCNFLKESCFFRVLVKNQISTFVFFFVWNDSPPLTFIITKCKARKCRLSNILDLPRMESAGEPPVSDHPKCEDVWFSSCHLRQQVKAVVAYKMLNTMENDKNGSSKSGLGHF